MELGDYLTESWDTQNSNPPIPHAELLTLNELAKQLDNIPVEKLTKKLEDNKIKFNSTTETLSEIGVINNISPAEIYNLISKKSTTNMTGMGIGRKTLEEYAKENDMDIDKVIKLLLDNNIKAQKNQTLKDIASENDMAPMDVDALIKKVL